MVILGSGLDTRPYRIARYSDLSGLRGRPAGEHRPQDGDGPARTGRACPPRYAWCVADFEHDNVLRPADRDGLTATPDGRCSSGRASPSTSPPTRVHGMFEQLRAVHPGSRLIFSLRPAGLHRWHGSVWRAVGLPASSDGAARCGSPGSPPNTWKTSCAGTGGGVIEQAGPSYYRDMYIRPTKRHITASPIEWTGLRRAQTIASDLDDRRNDHRLTAVGLAHPLADRAAHRLRDAPRGRSPVPRQGASSSAATLSRHRLQCLGILGEAPRVQVRAAPPA